MSCLGLSFTDRRRARLARKIRLEQVEPRSLITDPLSLAGLSMGLPAVWGILGFTRAGALGGNAGSTDLLAAQGGGEPAGEGNALAANQPLAQPLFTGQPVLPLRIVPAAGFSGSAAMPATINPAATASSGNWLTLLSQESASSPSPPSAVSRQLETGGTGRASSWFWVAATVVLRPRRLPQPMGRSRR